jgi:hypothetical protein
VSHDVKELFVNALSFVSISWQVRIPF